MSCSERNSDTIDDAINSDVNEGLVATENADTLSVDKDTVTATVKGYYLPDFNQEWDSFRKDLALNAPIDWNDFVLIEGQLGEDYAHLFDLTEVRKALFVTDYLDLDRVIFEGEHAHRFRVNVFESKTAYTYDFFFIEFNDLGLKMVGFEVFEQDLND